MIDWQDLTAGYNKRFGTDFDIEQMVRHLYTRFDSMKKAADFLGVSHSAFGRQLRIFNVPINLQAGRRPPNTAARLKRIHPRTLECMTLEEISKDINRSVGRVQFHMGQLGLKWKR